MNSSILIKKLLYLLILVILLNNCNEKPDSPEYNNILDPSVEFDNIPPIVNVVITPQSGIAGETEFVFDASGSKELEMPNAKLKFGWDIDNDGKWEWLNNYKPRLNYVFKKGGGERFVKLLVRGAKDLYSDTTVSVYVNTRPIILLKWIADSLNENLIHFDASSSWDAEDGNNLLYRWDFDNDDSWEIEWNDKPQTEKVFHEEEWSVKIEIKDTYDLVSYKIINRNYPDDYIAYFKFNGSANDDSRNENHGIISGATFTRDRFDRYDAALWFDGFDDYVRVPDNDILSSTDNKLTIAIITKVFSANGKFFLYKGDTRNNREYFMGIDSKGNANFGVVHQGESWGMYSISNLTQLDVDQWYHIVGTWDGSDMKIYINGNLNAVASAPVVIGNYSSDLYIGSYGGDIPKYAISAIIDDIKIFNRDLSADEVLLLYNYDISND
jgi:hypothetical protein